MALKLRKGTHEPVKLLCFLTKTYHRETLFFEYHSSSAAVYLTGQLSITLLEKSKPTHITVSSRYLLWHITDVGVILQQRNYKCVMIIVVLTLLILHNCATTSRQTTDWKECFYSKWTAYEKAPSPVWAMSHAERGLFSRGCGTFML